MTHRPTQTERTLGGQSSSLPKAPSLLNAPARYITPRSYQIQRRFLRSRWGGQGGATTHRHMSGLGRGRWRQPNASRLPCYPPPLHGRTRPGQAAGPRDRPSAPACSCPCVLDRSQPVLHLGPAGHPGSPDWIPGLRTPAVPADTHESAVSVVVSERPSAALASGWDRGDGGGLTLNLTPVGLATAPPQRASFHGK